jgi:hypothetical protein
VRSLILVEGVLPSERLAHTAVARNSTKKAIDNEFSNSQRRIPALRFNS